MSDWNQAIIEEFRANAGVVGGRFEGKKLLILGTTGAKSGLPRLNPLRCVVDGERYVIFASNAGRSTHPGWYYNLVANPEVTVEVGQEQFQAMATVAAEPERTEVYEDFAASNPIFAEYQQGTKRVIPVVVLERVR